MGRGDPGTRWSERVSNPDKFHPFHEEIGDPVSRVHIVSPAAVVSGVFAKLKKIVDVVVPCLRVSATGTTTLASLVHRDELVIMQFEEWDDTLRLAISSFNEPACAANSCP